MRSEKTGHIQAQDERNDLGSSEVQKGSHGAPGDTRRDQPRKDYKREPDHSKLFVP